MYKDTTNCWNKARSTDDAEMGKWVNINHMETPETSQSGSTSHASGRDLFFRSLLVSALFTFIMTND